MSFVLGESVFAKNRAEICSEKDVHFVTVCFVFFWGVGIFWVKRMLRKFGGSFFSISNFGCSLFVAHLGFFPMKFPVDPPPTKVNGLSAPIRTWMEYWNVLARITSGPWSLGNAPREALGILRPQQFFFAVFCWKNCFIFVQPKTQNIKGSKNANMGNFLNFQGTSFGLVT